MKKLDFGVIALVVILSVLPLFFFGGTDAAAVRVTQYGETLYEGALDTDAVINADGCTVAVSGGQARVVESDCPDGLCLASGAASRLHPLVCLPNELVVSIITNKEENLDGLSY